MTQRETDYKDRWQRMRLLATICVQPHLPRGKSMPPEKLIPFPWDKESKKAPKAKKMTAAEQRKRMKELAARLGDEMI